MKIKILAVVCVLSLAAGMAQAQDLGPSPYTTGTLGVGTSSPGGLLEVAGSSSSMIVHPVGWLTMYTRPGANYWQASNATGYFVFQSGGNTLDDITLQLLNNNDVTVPNGHLGVGTNEPDGMVEFKGRDASVKIHEYGWITSFTRAGTNYLQASAENGTFTFQTGGGSSTNTALTMDANQNVSVPNGNFWAKNEASAAVIEIRGEGQDLAEGFKVHGLKEEIKPGMVVSISADKLGEMELSSKPYQRSVAGIISGAGDKYVGLQLGKAEEVKRGELMPVALSGQVWCYVDASNDDVIPGDLLTTSSTPGHAMKVTDYDKAKGATIGKAMSRLAKGEKGLVLVLVSLQ